MQPGAGHPLRAHGPAGQRTGASAGRHADRRGGGRDGTRRRRVRRRRRPGRLGERGGPGGEPHRATNKVRGFVVYGLDGAIVATSDVGRVNNVDLRDGVDIGGQRTIVVAATNRTTETIDVLALDPETGSLADGSEANQNFKLVSWADVLDALGLPPAS